jgi:aconitate hydratase 2/2-methylisocitrate dehydratase
VSTSTRNFPNRLGDNTNVFLSSAELAAIAAVLGKLPTPAEYQEYAGKLSTMGAEIYRYLNFNEIESFQKAADKVKTIHVTHVQEVVM